MKPFLVSFSILLLTIPNIAFAHHRDPIRIESLDKSISFDILINNKAGGATLATADLGNDNVPEIIVGNGLGNEPRVRVLRTDGSEIGSFLAYAPNMGVGINVIACDLTGDGMNEIITSPQRGGGPHIRIFDGFGNAIDNGGFFAYSENFRGGVNLACGDLNGDGRAELVTLPGPNGGPHVRVWSYENTGTKLTQEFFAYDASDRSGIIGYINNQTLVVTQQHNNEPTLKTYDAKLNLVEEKKLSQKNILSIFYANENRYVTTQTGDIFSIDQDEKNFTNDLPIIATNLLNDKGDDQIIFITSKKFYNEDNATRIVVDISEQRLYAYKNGILDNTFLISSGLGNSTPIGKHHILAKIFEVDYTWSYGINDPRNYNLGLVPYNLRFYPHIYLHYAYWHNNFGHKMSHGCVNIGLENMKWLYNWASEGIEVEVQQ